MNRNKKVNGLTASFTNNNNQFQGNICLTEHKKNWLQRESKSMLLRKTGQNGQVVEGPKSHTTFCSQLAVGSKSYRALACQLLVHSDITLNTSSTNHFLMLLQIGRQKNKFSAVLFDFVCGCSAKPVMCCKLDYQTNTLCAFLS